MLEIKISRIKKEPKIRARDKARIYFWPTDSVSNVLGDDIHLRTKHYRSLLPEVFELVGVDQTQQKVVIRWSTTAGCSCGCSPGFIVESPNLANDLYVYIGTA